MIELLPPPLRRIASRLLNIKTITPVEGYKPYIIDYVDQFQHFGPDEAQPKKEVKITQ